MPLKRPVLQNFFSLEKLGKLFMLNFLESVAEYIFSIANSAYRAELKRREKLIFCLLINGTECKLQQQKEQALVSHWVYISSIG